MAKIIKLDFTECDAREEIDGLCSRLLKVPFKDWSYKGETRVHKKSRDEIGEGTFGLKLGNVSYKLSKSYKESEYQTRVCAVLGDEGYGHWEHYFSYSLKVSPQRQNAILIDGSGTDDNPIVYLYDNLDNKRETLKEKREEKVEEQRRKREGQERKKLHREGKKILKSLLRRKK